MRASQPLTRLQQRRIPLVEIKEPRLGHHPTLHRFTHPRDSSNRSTHQGVFEVSR
jgi:hypothetical protein